MTKLLRFDTQAGEVLIAPPPPPGASLAGLSDDAIATVNKSLDTALDVVGNVGQSLRSVLNKAGIAEAEVELGLQFTTEGSIYVLSGTAQAALKVTLKITAAGA